MNTSPAKNHFNETAGAEKSAPAVQSDNPKKQRCPFEHKAWLIAAYALLIVINITGVMLCR